MMEGSGSGVGSVPLNNGSGKPKNFQILVSYGSGSGTMIYNVPYAVNRDIIKKLHLYNTVTRAAMLA
jgi:hypothetical protein